MAGLKDYTLNPKKGSNKLTKWIGNAMDWQDVGETARNVGFAGVDALGYMVPGGALVTAATGKTATDFLEGAGVKTYTDSDLGRGFAKVGDVAGTVMNSTLPIATGIAGTAFGLPPQAGMAIGGVASGLGKGATANMTSATERMDQEKLARQQKQESMYKFKSGGLNQYRTINIEKGELLVNPKTLEILDNYNDAPKHPEGKHEIDIRGNREVPVGMAIIPAKLANEFKSATPERKKEIINSLPGFNGNPKMDGGTQLVGGQSLPILGGDVANAVETYQSPQADSGNNIMPYAVAGATAPAMGFGLYQTIAANKALKKLGKEPYAMYNEQVQPELQASYGAAQGRAADAALRSRYGLSQAQQAQYNQNVARDINTRMQRAQDIGGGNVGQTVGTIMNANKIQAAQQQAALDAQLQMQKQQYADRAAQYAEGLAQRIAAARQGQQNQNTAFQQSLRLQKERAYGQAKQQGMENMMNAPMQAASILATYYGGK